MSTTFDRGQRMLSGCGLSGFMSLTGERVDGRAIRRSIALLHDRSNGLGGGFAAYGIYPEFREFYALHIMFMSREAQKKTESFLPEHFKIVTGEEIPHDDKNAPPDPPMLQRYFVAPPRDVLQKEPIEQDNYVVQKVMEINTQMGDAFVFSSGKNMGVFKGLGYPEQVGRFFKLNRYKGYIWVVHSRYPTNTQAWWGGAHPFSILDWTVVHNGELSSYGINKRYLEMYGYHSTMQTDSEVIAYAADLLMRKHSLPIEVVASIMAPPFWEQIDRMEEKKRNFHKYLRMTYGSLLMNGPFKRALPYTILSAS